LSEWQVKLRCQGNLKKNILSRKGKEEIGSRQAWPGKLLSDTSKNMKNGFCKMAFIDEKRESTVMQSFVAYAKWLSFSCSSIVPFACP
jgi:hypothetical protein